MATIKTKRDRVKFASDNVTGACPEVLAVSYTHLTLPTKALV